MHPEEIATKAVTLAAKYFRVPANGDYLHVALFMAQPKEISFGPDGTMDVLMWIADVEVVKIRDYNPGPGRPQD
jgi:hypothetical protein